MIRIDLALSASALLAVLAIAGNAGQDGSVRPLRFSPDGKYVLAQNDSEIALIEADRFVVLFRLASRNAATAQFTPDSREIMFISSITQPDSSHIRFNRATPYVERWSIRDRVRVGFTAVPPVTCGIMVLSQNGKTLACTTFTGALQLIDVSAGEIILELKKFARPRSLWIGQGDELHEDFSSADLGKARLEFSPEGRFLIAFPLAGLGPTVICDVLKRRIIKPEGRLQTLRSAQDFSFIGPDRLLISHSTWGRSPTTGRIVEVPSGRLISSGKIPSGQIFKAADSRLLIVHPYPTLRESIVVLGECVLFELATRKAVAIDTPLDDVFGDHYVGYLKSGEVGLWAIGKGLIAKVPADAR